MAQQLERHAGRNHPAGGGQRDRGQRLAAHGAGAGQGRDLVAQLGDGGFVPGQLDPAGRQRRFGLLDLHLGVQPGGLAAARQVHHFGALAQHALQHLALREGVLQVEVAAHDGARQQVAGGLRVGVGRVALRNGGLQAGAVLAPEVQLVAEVQRQPVVADHRAAGGRGIDVVLRQVFAGERVVGVHARQQRRARAPATAALACASRACAAASDGWLASASDTRASSCGSA
ncbi:Uncharacterised protein [Bordetella pertussis]|nr:Uncharacterised protein [Bordetella pertussis]CFN63876.1 Uncharacterised protein [Bordetella pertussis]CFN87745.1 Uncharacterised protein [Bordetella pertussis]CFU08045.1 Uncharacterised protein [Bordetella pertussis]CFW36799.1 Uncharacterised protein [Bordetella pertussis]